MKDRIDYAIKQFESHGIILGNDSERGIHALIKILEE